jgi:hypothetical protein
VIVAIENPQDIIVQSARPYGQRAVLKFAQYTGCQAIAGRHTPGTFTNQLQNTFSEPRLLILTDPRTDHQVRNNRFANFSCDFLYCRYIIIEDHADVAFALKHAGLIFLCSQSGKQHSEIFL